VSCTADSLIRLMPDEASSNHLMSQYTDTNFSLLVEMPLVTSN